MVTKVTTANSYSDAELLALFREGAALIAATGQSYQVAGRTFNAASLPVMWDTIERLEARISAASSGPIATNLARLVRR